MKQVFALMYHDVVPPGGCGMSGIQGADADIYKLTQDDFCRHLDAIGALGKDRVRTCLESPSDAPVYLTFDDGGISALWTAEELERRSWRGHFFITSDWIGQPGFVSAADLRGMAARGHVVGSHSCSHPKRISALPADQIRREWAASVERLSDVLGSAVTVASVPGGFYSRQVANLAAQAGITMLFNSEPTAQPRQAGSCLLFGRYFLQQGMGPEVAANFAGGPGVARLRQAALWKIRKAAKALGGDLYAKMRKSRLARSSAG